MYGMDTNYIDALRLKSRQSKELVRGFNECYDRLKRAGFNAVLQRLDNEISKELITAIENEGLKYQIVSPGNHRTNQAE